MLPALSAASPQVLLQLHWHLAQGQHIMPSVPLGLPRVRHAAHWLRDSVLSLSLQQALVAF